MSVVGCELPVDAYFRLPVACNRFAAYETDTAFFLLDFYFQRLILILYLTNPQKVQNSVMPAKAGIQNYLNTLDSRLRGNDVKGRIWTFYETIILHSLILIHRFRRLH
jgi:hypothetical protein